MSKIVIESLNVLPARVEQLISELKPHSNIWAFDAPMGAGKTTIIREICKQLQVVDNVISPTFSIINEYRTQDGKHIYHFDFYRLNKLEEAIAIGVEEYFESDSLCLIEWSRLILPILPKNYNLIKINALNDDTRILTLETITI
ncbi:MAG TPA: tRNA (adenosine(37)-N6)-threonylcarbamoyltransferase complex ATPase subunit type 1 TsaE [Salinivirgaceae bacterium]|nr:tRNA (adenosine(37)-N6)-threonylcarbamoyltransferase complex ATPase subunit type 1 TsaE [Salinivirgaceae bacterium]